MIEEKHPLNQTSKVSLNKSIDEEIYFVEEIKTTFTFERMKEKIQDLHEIYINYIDTIHNKLGPENDYRNLIIFFAVLFGLAFVILLKSNLNFKIICG